LYLRPLAAAAHAARAADDPLDGPKRIFHDDLLDNLAGKWSLTREIRGKTQQNTVDAEWLLNHRKPFATDTLRRASQ